MINTPERPSVTLVEHDNWLTLAELCELCNMHPDTVVELAEYGVVEPDGTQRANWRFRAVAVTRIRRANRLRNELGLNLPGVALASDLLDEIEQLRTLLDRQP